MFRTYFRTGFAIPALVLIISLFVYLSALCPGISLGDAGELISASYTLGIAHPPGYPVFTLLGKLFTFLPLGTIAGRINLMAALFGALAGTFLALLLIRITKKTASGLLALVFVFSPLFWQSSVAAEVYSLNMFFISSLLLLAYRSTGSFLGALFGGLLFGLSLGNHNTMLLFLPLFLYFFSGGKYFSVRPAAAFLAGGVFGFGLTCWYLYLRSGAAPLINWGDPSTAERLFSHIIRKEYGALVQMPYSAGLFLKQLFHYFILLWSQFFILLPLSVIGAVQLYKSNRKAFVLTIYVFLTFLAVPLMINYEPSPRMLDIVKVFFLPSIFAVTVFAVFFLASLPERFFIFVTLSVFMSNYQAADMSKNTEARSFASDILNSCSKDSALIVGGDNPSYTTIYMKACEQARPDLLLINESGTMMGQAFGRDFFELTPAKKAERRALVYRELSKIKQLYFTAGTMLSNEDENIFVPCGLVYALNLSGKLKPVPPPAAPFNMLYERPTGDYLANELRARYFYQTGEYKRWIGKRAEAASCYDTAYGFLYMDPGVTGLKERTDKRLLQKNPLIKR